MGLLLHVYIESGPPAMVKKIKQRSSYTPYHSNILTRWMSMGVMWRCDGCLHVTVTPLPISIAVVTRTD